MNNQDYKALYYINKIIDTGTVWEPGLISYNQAIQILPVNKETNIGREELCVQIKNKIKQLGKNYNKKNKNKEEKKLEILTQIFNLSSIEREILTILYMYDTNKIFREFVYKIEHTTIGVDYPTLKLFFKQNIFKYVDENSFLSKLGLIVERYGKIALTSFSHNILNQRTKSVQKYITDMLGEPLKSNLNAKDFTYIKELDFALKMINNPTKKGLNILLYGFPGTGKTAFAKMIARETKKKLYSVGEEQVDEASKNFRLKALYRSLRVLNKKENNCLLFDEAEDIFSNGRTSCNKVEINRLLEENTTPVIWTTNNIAAMDRAFVRRFTLAIHFSTPPKKTREKIWQKYLNKNKIIAPKSEVSSLAKDYIIPPSMIETSALATKMVNGNVATLKEHITIMKQALNNGYKKPEIKKDETIFCPEILNTDLDLEKLKNQLVNLGKLNFSLCLYGASGTGKSLYARYLADKLGLKYCQKRASDLVSSFVGRTEQNIAMAFAQAREEKSLLIFDEADSFLQDRANARYSWEKTAVNEMLTWMESHPYPFICTTNLMDNLDPASLRRFTFKVKYDFLTAEQIKIAFKHFFNLKVEEQDISGLKYISPADFTLIKNKAEIMGFDKDVKTLVKMLLCEQNLKEKQEITAIGFHTEN